MRTAYEENRRYFRQAYETGSHGWESRVPSPYVERNLAAVAASATGRRLLDLGCGEGRHSLLAARLGFVPTGVDYEPRAISRARKFADEAGLGDAVTWLVADVLRLPFRPGSFDVVIDYGCLHHQKKSNWPDYLAAVTTALTPEGHFLLSVFSTAFRTYGPQERAWHLAHGAYRRFFTAGELRRLFDPAFEFLSLEEEREERRGFWHARMQRRPAHS
jgi:cyclopropane fatty-acyl-phospholipid synthase-like methyltransferase